VKAHGLRVTNNLMTDRGNPHRGVSSSRCHGGPGANMDSARAFAYSLSPEKPRP